MLVLVCRGTECGGRRGSARVYERFQESLRGAATTTLSWQSCFGQCQKGVNVLVREVRPGDDPFFTTFVPAPGRGAILYHGVRPEEVPRIVDEHVVGGRVVEELRRRGR